jgi:hypothetical protein
MKISDISIIQSSIIHLVHLIDIRLSVDSNDVETSSVINIGNELFTGLRLKHVKMDMCARTTFNNVNKLSNIEQLSIAWCQLQELTHLLQYTPKLYTLKATICGLQNADSWTETICGYFTQRYFLRLNSLKLVVDSISFDHLLLLLHELTQLRSLWLLLNHHEYMNVDKWENLFQSSLSKLDQLDLTIALIKPPLPGNLFAPFVMLQAPYIAFEKFNTKFWFDRGWCPRLDEYDHCVRLTVSNTTIPMVKRAKRH